jgi:hypothetical protein
VGSVRSMGPFWAVLAVTLPCTVAAYSSVRGDIWWNLSTGRWVVEHHALPTTYPFSFAPQVGQFYDTQWLAHVIFYGMYGLLGVEGIVLVDVFVVTATFAFVLAIAWHRSGNRYVAAVCTAGCAVLALSNLQPRAQVFGFLLFAASYWLVTVPRRGPATLVALGAVEVTWANTHGSSFLGPVLTSLLLGGEVVELAVSSGWRDRAAQRRFVWLGAALVIQGLALLVTPYGLAGFGYAYGAMTDPTARRYGEEWLPPTLSTFTGGAFFASLAMVAAAVAFSRRIRPADALVLLLFAWFGFQAVRNVIWWGMAMTPILAAQLSSTPLRARLEALEASARAQAQRRRGVDRMMAGLLVCLMIGTLPWVKAWNPIVPDEDRRLVSAEEPERAAAFLEAHDLPSRMFAPQVWGAYLGWRLWPRYASMVGPIIEIHPASVWTDYLRIASGGAGWDTLLDAYGVDLLVLDAKEQARLVDLLRVSGTWAELYADGQATIFRRAQPPRAEARAEARADEG